MEFAGLLGVTRLCATATRLPGAVARTAATVTEPLVQPLTRSRRTHVSAGHRHIAVRGVHLPGSESMARALRRALLEVTGVSRAEVNAILGYVMVVHGEDVPVDELIAVVEDVERLHGAATQSYAPASHPADGRALLRETVLAGADLAGCALAIAGKAVRATPLPPGVPAALAMADVTPQVRRGLVRLIGRPATDLTFGAGTAVLHALAQQPTGLLLDSVHRAVRIAELRAHRATWNGRAPDMDTGAGAFEATPLDPSARPVPLRAGPIERMALGVPAALAATVSTVAITRDGGRAQGVLAAGVPKAARLGREAFATRFGRMVAGRGIVVLEPDALRRLDRVDRIVVDASALRTGATVIDAIVQVSETVSAGEVYERAHALIDVHHPKDRHERDGWAVAPVGAGTAGLGTAGSGTAGRGTAGTGTAGRGTAGAAGRGTAAQHVRGVAARGLRRNGGTVLMLTRGGEPVALVSVLPELDPKAEALVAAARAAGPVVIAGGSRGLARRLGVDQTVPGGGRLRASVQTLQQDGHGVVLISAHGGAALAAADVGIGLLGGNTRPPWGADLLCGPDLDGACLIVGALAAARRASGRSAEIAAVGSTAGVLVAATGPAARAARRAQLAVDLAAASALMLGTWSAEELSRLPGPVPVDRTPWHAWPAQAVLDRLGSSPSGIEEAEAARRRADGARQAAAPASAGLVRLAIEELDNPLTPALAAGAAVAAVVGSVVDAALIGTVLGANALVSGVQRLGAERALRQLVDLSAVRVRLRRPRAAGAGSSAPAAGTGRLDPDSETDSEVMVVADELVPGDVVTLTAGDAVPADCRLLVAEGLEIDESSLTGESQLVAKSADPSVSAAVADRHSMLYEGTVVAAGQAVAVVVATGAGTEMGRSLRAAEGQRKPGGVAVRMRRLTEVTLPISIGAGAVLLGSGLLRGQPLAQGLGSAVSLAVAAVPEGLPFVATAAELATARRLSGRGALVRNPGTIEALGRTDVLCFDKTGTLTEGRLRLRQVSDGCVSSPLARPNPAHRAIIAAALRANPEQNGGARLPHPTDRAITRAGRQLGLTTADGLGSWKRVDELPFEPGRGYHAVLGRAPGGQVLSVKGAPEIILERCVSWRRDGELVPFGDAEQQKVVQEVDRLARLGYRVLAVADRQASGRQDLTESRIDRLCFLGLLGIADPVRPTAAMAVSRLLKAGVQIIMITGDHPSTAEAIAAELGVSDGRIMTGAALDTLDDTALAEQLPHVSVFARVSPAQKARVVQALRAAGRVVAVTGDGANDAPAIRLADVGIALGERATAAARQTADLVVTDDRIETITDAIIDCRAMWRSTRDALAVLLGGNLGEIGFTVGTSLVSGTSPLNVRQLLLVNLLTDMLPAMALAVRKPAGVTRAELLAEGPERSLGTVLTRDIAVRAVTTAGAAELAWLLARLTGTRGQAATTGLVTLVATQLAQTIAAGGRDPLVLSSSLAALGALVITVQVPGVSHFFGNRPLLPHCWLIGLGSAALFALAAVILTRLRGGASDRAVPAAPPGPGDPAVATGDQGMGSRKS
jgi:cation-transporting P-type ATPase I